MAEPKNYENRILTIPNALSLFRIVLIPVFAWLYLAKQQYWATAGVLVLSGITDTLDGFIARHFNMISNFGKALDPVADKLTQITILVCLLTRFRWMLLPVILLTVKEICSGIGSVMVIHRTGEVHGAVWHGKITTVLLYATMILHVVWLDIPLGLSTALILFCSAWMLLSMILYLIRNIGYLRAAKENQSAENNSK